MPNRARQSGFRKKIEVVHWTLIAESVVTQAAGISAKNALVAQHLPETLLRIRGEWAAQFAGQVAPGVGVSVAAGLIQVPEGTGTTVLWSPFTDGDAPWIWWDVLHLLYAEPVTDVIGSGLAGARRIMDSRAMRKIRNTELQFVVENVTVTGLGAATIDSSMAARVLSGS